MDNSEENRSYGFVAMFRSLQQHWLYPVDRPFTELEAWIDLIYEANHKDKSILIKGKLIRCRRGESVRSITNWAKRWNWSKSKTYRFLELLKTDGMIETTSETVTTRITICNYDSYQTPVKKNETHADGKRTTNETQSDQRPTAEEPHPDSNKNAKYGNNGNNSNNQNPDESSESETCYSFDDFWDDYDNKKERMKCEGKWKNISESNRKLIKGFIPVYKAHQPDYRYRKNPSTFLNNEIWKDDWEHYPPQSNINKKSKQYGSVNARQILADTEEMFRKDNGQTYTRNDFEDFEFDEDI